MLRLIIYATKNLGKNSFFDKRINQICQKFLRLKNKLNKLDLVFIFTEWRVSKNNQKDIQQT